MEEERERERVLADKIRRLMAWNMAASSVPGAFLCPTKSGMSEAYRTYYESALLATQTKLRYSERLKVSPSHDLSKCLDMLDESAAITLYDSGCGATLHQSQQRPS
jgi:hypothetical protein